jgi:hypothetical protein
MLLDLSVQAQSYVEDCEVCCRALELRVLAEEGSLAAFEAYPLEG